MSLTWGGSMQPCDVERIYATNRQALIRKGSRYVLIDLDEDEKRKKRIEGWIAAFICGVGFWAVVLL